MVVARCNAAITAQGILYAVVSSRYIVDDALFKKRLEGSVNSYPVVLIRTLHFNILMSKCTFRRKKNQKRIKTTI